MSFDEAEWWMARVHRENVRLSRRAQGGTSGGDDGWLDESELDDEAIGDDTGATPTHHLRVSDFNLPDIDELPDPIVDEDDGLGWGGELE